MAVLAVLLVAIGDWWTGAKVSFSVFCCLLLALAAWSLPKTGGLSVALVAAVISLAVEIVVHWGNPFPATLYWDAAVRSFVFVAIVLLVSHLRSRHLQLGTALASRTHALEEERAGRLDLEHEVAMISQREQQRIACELHDGLGQELGAAAFQATLLADRLGQTGHPLAQQAIGLAGALSKAVGHTRALSSLLDPLSDESAGLELALSHLADRSALAFGITCVADASAPVPKLPLDTQLHLYRIAQEAIHNAVRHGHAAQVHLHLALRQKTLRLSISDDGAGFDADSLPARPPNGLGLRIMRCRTDALQARLEIRSKPGQGCVVSCLVPLPGVHPSPC